VLNIGGSGCKPAGLEATELDTSYETRHVVVVVVVVVVVDAINISQFRSMLIS
jgi:hypothetical protein